MLKKGCEERGLIFSEDRQMSVETYDRLKKRYSSRPPFVFFFNPTIQSEQIISPFSYYVGYAIKRNGFTVSIDFKS